MKEANLMRTSETHRPRQWRAACALLLIATPLLAYAQAAGSPFMTGATALESNILAWLTPIAIILVMALGALAMANRMSWGWCIGAILGIAIAFGAPQIVAWVRGMFGV
jgi:type IV secretion system protein VirB2